MPNATIVRRVSLVIAGLLALAIVAVLALPSLLDVNRYRPQIESRLQQRLGRAVTLGPMQVSLRPLGFRAEEAVIGEDPSFPKERPFAEVGELYVSPELLPLLRGEVRISRALLQRPRIELVRGADGRWNFESLATESQEPSGDRRFELNALKVEQGQVAVTDLREGQERTVYEDIDVELRDYSAGQPFTVRGAVALPGGGSQVIRVDGTAGPIASDGALNTPLDGRLTFETVSLSALSRFVKSSAFADAAGVLTGTATLQSRQGRFSSDGTLRLEQPRLRGVEFGYPVSADYAVEGDWTGPVLRVGKGDLRLGETPVTVTGVFDFGPEPAQVAVKAKAVNAAMGEVARLASAFGLAFDPDTTVAGRLDADLSVQGAATKPGLEGEVKARDLRISGGELKQPVHVAAVELTLTPQTLRSSRFSAATGSSKVAIEFAVDDYSGEQARLRASVDTGEADLGSVLDVARAYGAGAVEGVSGSGMLRLEVTVSGPLRQPERLTCTGSGAVRNATLALPALGRPLELRNADLRFTSDSVALENVVLAVGKSAARGRLKIDGFASPRVRFRLDADTVDVAEWQQLASPAAGPGARTPPPAARPRPLQGVTGSGVLTVETLIHDEIKLSNLRSDVILDDGVIHLSPVSAEAFGGTQRGAIVVDASTVPATYTVDSRFERVDANRLLSSVTSLKEALYGLLAASADVRFSGEAGQPQIARSLTGKASLDLRDGRIAGVDLLHRLAEIGRFQSLGRASEPFTRVVRLTGDFDIRGGVATTDDLEATIAGATLAATGRVDLNDQSLDLKLTAVLSPETSQQVGGTRIGGFLSTALANERGELVMPVIVTGTWTSPRFAPDVQKIGEMKLNNLLPSRADPSAATSRLVGSVLDRLGRRPRPSPRPEP